jgi:pimeloyl-ACP methyl ester carboxylesterase
MHKIPCMGSLDITSVACRDVTDPHGVRIAYWVLGRGDETLVLANGLGGRLAAWGPLLGVLAERYRLITWDYRGLFDSGLPKNPRYLGVSHQAEDLRRILDAERCEYAILCGWSMGVQVSLDFAAHYPDRVRGMVLVNGTYGHAFSSALQPFIPLPYAAPIIHRVVEAIAEQPWFVRALAKIAPHVAGPVGAIFELATGVPRAQIRPVVDRYVEDLCNPKSFGTYVRLAQELDAHSSFVHLRDIVAPTLIVSGAWDPLTPAHRSRVMARRMPNAQLLRVPRATHFAVLERPQIVIPAIERFLAELPPQPQKKERPKLEAVARAATL